MNSMEQLSDTDLGQAVLLSQLSGKPVNVVDNVFVWNGTIMDRATAIVVLLKAYNQVPINNNVTLTLYTKYQKTFEKYSDSSVYVSVYQGEADVQAMSRMWLSKIIKRAKGSIPTLTPESVKQILISLHTV
jgi:hypothetical protein